MIFTAKEAFIRFCPTNGPANKCIGEECMGWRWYDPLVDPLSEEPGPKSRRGYCGLAGKPEHEE